MTRKVDADEIRHNIRRGIVDALRTPGADEIADAFERYALLLQHEDEVAKDHLVASNARAEAWSNLQVLARKVNK